jgi:hypothetical protein
MEILEFDYSLRLIYDLWKKMKRPRKTIQTLKVLFESKMGIAEIKVSIIGDKMIFSECIVSLFEIWNIFKKKCRIYEFKELISNQQPTFRFVDRQ